MTLLEKLKNNIGLSKISDNKKIYRLHYLYFNSYIFGEMHDYTCTAFMIPENFSEKDAFKVISYFFDHTQYETGEYRCCCETTEKLITTGFKQIDDVQNNEYDIVDLFSVISTDNGTLFKKSEYYKDYFEWYSFGVTKEEIEEIYSKNNMDLMSNPKKILKKNL